MSRHPIFPLGSVLFPGGPLQLRIFERRYLDMVTRCLREDLGFGVCLIADGREVGVPATPCPIGTLARIIDWNTLPDGLLGITAIGGERFRLDQTERGENGLLWADVELIASVPAPPLPEQPKELSALLDQIFALEGLGYEHVQRNEDDPHWLSWRLAEVLPISPEDKYALLALDDPYQRLTILRQVVPSIRID